MYKCIYDKANQSILLRPTLKFLTLALVIVLFSAFTGIYLLFYTAPYTINNFLVGVFGCVFALCLLVYSIAYYCNTSFFLDEDGICVRGVNKRTKHLRWSECSFIGLWRYGRRGACSSLLFSKCTAPRDSDGKIPQDYVFPLDESISLADPWNSLTEDEQQIILQLCGGMRG